MLWIAVIVIILLFVPIKNDTAQALVTLCKLVVFISGTVFGILILAVILSGG